MEHNNNKSEYIELNKKKKKINQYNNRTNRTQEIVKINQKLRKKVADWHQWRQKGILMFNTFLFSMFQGLIF